MRSASHKKQRIMKATFPTLIRSRSRDSFDGGKSTSRRSPVTDYNYHSVALEGSSAAYAHARTRSFWNITGDYYKSEARQDFWGEASLWAVLALTAFLPLISNAHAVMEFVRAISTY
jgi:rhamnogalacturonyl hydrolase YesR